MRRTPLVVIAVIGFTALSLVPADLADACGDKWLVSARSRGSKVAATTVHAGQVLIFESAIQSASSELFDETVAETIRSANHEVTYINAENAAGLLAEKRFDLVLFAWDDADEVEALMSKASGPVALLPVLDGEDDSRDDALARFGRAVPCCSLATLLQRIEETVVAVNKAESS